jgi:hypothetical protein
MRSSTLALLITRSAARSKRVAGIILTQLLPFADHQTLKLYGEFETAVYGALKAA